uniref:Flap endonuclease 1 n=1 Tax=Percolomonas cosmopolitus TaxID=63605 RepID=A0A7S1PFF3_9EUKA
MGIKNLKHLLQEYAPDSFKESEIKNYFSRTIAIDGNMSMYQFVISMRNTGFDLSDASGEITSHLQGLLYRTTKMIEIGIKPVFVFDGKPPDMKSDELAKRREKMKEAKDAEAAFKEAGDEAQRIKMSKRSVRVTRDQIEDAKKLLRAMGVPCVDAPSEAESQCAEMCRAGVVFATGTEDMDALTFGSKRLVRHLTFSEARKKPILEFDLDVALQQMEMNMDQFIDLCILCGCDYCGTIKGIGYKKAYKYLKELGSIERVITFASTKESYTVPEDFLTQVVAARKLFKEPDVIPGKQITFKFTAPNEEEMVTFLNEKGFDEKRVRKVAERLRSARKLKAQNRLDAFITVKKRPIQPVSGKKTLSKKKTTTTTKRKRTDSAASEGKAPAAKKRRYNF